MQAFFKTTVLCLKMNDWSAKYENQLKLVKLEKPRKIGIDELTATQKKHVRESKLFYFIHKEEIIKESKKTKTIYYVTYFSLLPDNIDKFC